MKREHGENEHVVPPRLELEGRHKAIRHGMRERNLDVLIFQSNSQRNAYGYMRYMCGNVNPSFYSYLLFPVEGEVTYVGHYGGSAKEAQSVFGIEDSRYVPWNPTNAYALDAVYVADVIKEKKAEKVGLVPFATMSADFYASLLQGLPGVKIEDATDVVDRVKMVKSPEEQRLIERSASIGDLAMEVFRRVARPGRRVREVVADIDHEVKIAGSEDQFYLVGGPTGVAYFNRWDRVLRQGDAGTFLAELSGPGGYWTDTNRTFSIGTPSHELKKAFEAALEAQTRAIEHLKPGGSFKAAYEAIDKVILGNEYFHITHAYGHGQGIDIYERPCVHKDEKTVIQPGIEMSVHPSASWKGGYAIETDNFVITENRPKRWQKTPQEMIVI